MVGEFFDDAFIHSFICEKMPGIWFGLVSLSPWLGLIFGLYVDQPGQGFQAEQFLKNPVGQECFALVIIYVAKR